MLHYQLAFVTLGFAVAGAGLLGYAERGNLIPQRRKTYASAAFACFTAALITASIFFLTWGYFGAH